ncbi:hypothetical protein [uncultured Williamsia sp.]|uniref:DUF6924 domain-containing protein n=1 Tax=uncultured Williamsia sp. TaxID=259311 RepID=UPI0026060495|nr:hypothetical protein [uncultured Williamsia sp.]
MQHELGFVILYLVGRDATALPGIDFGETGRLAYFAGDGVVLFTGATYGLTQIVSELLDGEPPLDTDWETVEEGSVVVTGDLVLLPHPSGDTRSLRDLEAIPIVDAGPGTYRVRVSAIGREPDRNDVALRIQLWESDEVVAPRTLTIGDAFMPESITSVIAQPHVAPGRQPASRTLPASDVPLLIRTDFSSDEAWFALVEEVRLPAREIAGAEFVADVRPISDRRFDGATPEDVVAANAEGDDPPWFVFVVDSETLGGDDAAVLTIDLDDDPGSSFRVPANLLWLVESNLSLGNVDFDDFARSATDGVFRGFDEDGGS